MRRTLLSLFLLPLLAVGFGCSDSTGPAAVGDTGNAWGEGSLDPGAGTFLLQTVDVPLPDGGQVVALDLVGSNLQVDAAAERVTLDVALRNRWSGSLYAPAALWLRDFAPEGAAPENADWIVQPPVVPGDETFADWIEYGWDFSGFLGGDEVLEPGETSASRTLVFHAPDLAPFAFAARAEFGMLPDLPRLGGRVFRDLDLDGLPGETEPGYVAGAVTVVGPDSLRYFVQPDAWGVWSVPVDAAGLYAVRWEFMTGSPVDPPLTTPNPLQVVLTPGSDGRPRSFLDAHFGVAEEWPPDFGRPIGFTDAPLESLHVDHYLVSEVWVERIASLAVRVGFSGCGPDQPFALWTDGAFMESFPVQVDAVLVKETVQDCDAAFMDERRFDLRPLYERFLVQYGPGELILNLHCVDGSVHPIPLPIYPVDGD